MRIKMSVAAIFVKVLCVIFAVEAFIMFILPVIISPSISTKAHAFLDAFLLTVMSAPLLWWVIIEPILREQSVRKQAERTLFETQAKLQIAAEIQKKLLPDAMPVLEGADISAGLKPTEATSGDFYDFLTLPDGSMGIVIADVSGHGIDSAILVAAASAYLRALARTSNDLGEILALLNEFLVEQSEEDRFLTLFFARIDPEKFSLSYAAAGHRAYHFRGNRKVSVLNSTGIPLGLVPGIDIPSKGPIPLERGETLLFLTDGIEEATSPDGELFGSDRVKELIESHRNLSAQDTLDLLYREVRRFSGATPQKDDMTAIVFKVL